MDRQSPTSDRSTVDDECCSTIVGFSRRHVVDNWPPEKLQSFPGTCFSSVGNIVPGGRDVGWRLCARLFRRECSRDPGQQVRHYSLVCRRMCLDGAGLATEREKMSDAIDAAKGQARSSLIHFLLSVGWKSSQDRISNSSGEFTFLVGPSFGRRGTWATSLAWRQDAINVRAHVPDLIVRRPAKPTSQVASREWRHRCLATCAPFASRLLSLGLS